MRITPGYGDQSNLKDRCFTALVQECRLSAPGYKLSDSLRKKIEILGKNERKDVVDQTSEFGCTPLFLACKNGSADVVEYLVSACGADIEQRGRFEVLDEGVSHSVTPLWCAAVSGRLSVVKILIAFGADVNAVSDSGSTPVRSACYIVRNGLDTSHFEVIKCLVRAGANIQTPNHFGGTCLINSVQSPELVSFLIENDVDVNAEDVQLKTALHYAVQENRLESAKLLLRHNADPHKRSKYGDDILQTACLKGNVMMLNYLMETVMYDPGRIADAFELIGSTYLLDLHDLGSTIFFWKKALEIRHDGRYRRFPKSENSRPHEVLKVCEIDSKEEFESIITDLQSMKVQALLITERILGQGHKDTIFRYMYAGAAHADANQYKQCVLLWNYALRLKVQKDTLLSYDTSFTARAIVQLYVNMLKRIVGLRQEDLADELNLHFGAISLTARLISEGLSRAIELLQIQPVFKTQADNFDVVLTSWIHLVHVLLKIAKTDEEFTEIYQIVSDALKVDPKTQNGGESLLHLVVSSSSTLHSNSFLDEDSYPLFPSAIMGRFLLSCGYNVDTRNSFLETPLHIACKQENYSEEVIKLLVGYDGHLDIPDMNGILPLDLLKSHSCSINVVPYISLKCLAAVQVKKNASALSYVPPFLQDFVTMH